MAGVRGYKGPYSPWLWHMPPYQRYDDPKGFILTEQTTSSFSSIYHIFQEKQRPRRSNCELLPADVPCFLKKLLVVARYFFMLFRVSIVNGTSCCFLLVSIPDGKDQRKVTETRRQKQTLLRCAQFVDSSTMHLDYLLLEQTWL